MPRFSKPAVENDQGEIIMPGAFSAAPGGICERRSTFEWDNQNGSGASGPLINVDELSVDLSEDDEDDGNCDNDQKDNESETCYPGTTTTVTRTTTTGSLGGSTILSQHDTQSQQQRQPSSRSDLFGDEEQGLSHCSSNDEQDSNSQADGPAEATGPRYVPQQPDAPVDAYIVEQRNSNPEPATVPKPPPSSFLGNRGVHFMIGVFFIILCVGLGVFISWQRNNSSYENDYYSNTNNQSPSLSFGPPSAEMEHREKLGLQRVIQEILVNERESGTGRFPYSLQNKLEPNWASPYYQALHWLLYEDPLQLTLGEGDSDTDKPNTSTAAARSHVATIQNSTAMVATKRVQQRYIMAAFYFATSQPSGPNSDLIKDTKRRLPPPDIWKHCGAPKLSTVSLPAPLGQQQEQDKMQCTHEELKSVGPRVYNSYPGSWRWLSSASECDWAGVICNDAGLVTSIDLADYGMQGFLLEELAVVLEELQVVSLPYNENLMGRIPSRLLRRVKHLELQYNQHEGPILDPLTKTDEADGLGWALEILNLTGNQLTGSLGSELGLFANIRQIFLDNNQLTGALPLAAFGRWTNLDRLRLNHNRFEGSISTMTFAPQAAMREIDLSDNDNLTGSIPSEIGTLGDSLRTLGLANMQLEGTLPVELYQLTKLAVLDLQNNTFSGTMATEIGQLSKLQELYWQSNGFEGNLPSELGNLAKIMQFRIDDNDFQGVLPTQFCELGPGNLPLAYTVAVVADCTPENDAGSSLTSSLICPEGCCATCCQKSTGECSVDPIAILGIKNMKSLPGDNP